MKSIILTVLLLVILTLSAAPLVDSQSDLEVTDFMMRYLENGEEIGINEKLRPESTIIVEIQALNIGAGIRNLSFSTDLENPLFYLDQTRVDEENVPVQLGKNLIRLIGDTPSTVTDREIIILQCKNIGFYEETTVEGQFIYKHQAYAYIILFCLVGAVVGALVTFGASRMRKGKGNKKIRERQMEILADFFRSEPLTSERKSRIKKLFRAMEKTWRRG